MELGTVAVVLVVFLLAVALSLWIKGDVKALVQFFGVTLALEAKDKKK